MFCLLAGTTRERKYRVPCSRSKNKGFTYPKRQLQQEVLTINFLEEGGFEFEGYGASISGDPGEDGQRRDIYSLQSKRGISCPRSIGTGYNLSRKKSHDLFKIYICRSGNQLFFVTESYRAGVIQSNVRVVREASKKDAIIKENLQRDCELIDYLSHGPRYSVKLVVFPEFR